jgi:DNA mismatch repair ATPase MutS
VQLAGCIVVFDGLPGRFEPDARAVGLVTTHDLALTEIADRLGEWAANAHFEDYFDNGELTFDYRMKPGMVRHTNGVALMRAVGIEV